MISTVTGKFNRFAADVQSTEDFTHPQIRFTADADSISTGSEQRDGHLKSDDFFNTALYPLLSFSSRSMEKTEVNKFKLYGDLTIRNKTKEITLDVVFNGLMTDPYGQNKAGFEVTGTINRKDFDLKWSATTEAGGLVVSDEVRIACNIQLVKQA